MTNVTSSVGFAAATAAAVLGLIVACGPYTTAIETTGAARKVLEPEDAASAQPEPKVSAEPVQAPTKASSAPPASPPNAPPAPAEVVPPKEPGSGLLQGHDGFASVRKGKALRLGSQGPAVVALQVMLLSWNYPLAIADVTGKYDEKTATAVFHYRLDNGISESKGGGPQGFDKQARAEGIFDQAALQAFEGRMGAEKQRAIREIDPRRGVRFQVRGTPSAAAVLAALFDEEELARIGKPETAVTLEKPNEAGESAAWISLRAFGCGRSTQVPPVECAGEK